MQTKVRGIRLDGTEKDISADRAGALYVSNYLRDKALLTAAGLGWRVINTTAKACVNAIPTTTAMFTLWNGSSDKYFIIDQVFANVYADPNSRASFHLISCIHPVGMAAPTADITAIKSLNGSGSYGGLARCDVDATVVNDGWYPAGTSIEVFSNNQEGGQAVVYEINGGIVLPPTAGLSLVGQASSTAITATHGFTWYEVYIDTE